MVKGPHTCALRFWQILNHDQACMSNASLIPWDPLLRFRYVILLSLRTRWDQFATLSTELSFVSRFLRERHHKSLLHSAVRFIVRCRNFFSYTSKLPKRQSEDRSTVFAILTMRTNSPQAVSGTSASEFAANVWRFVDRWQPVWTAETRTLFKKCYWFTEVYWFRTVLSFTCSFLNSFCRFASWKKRLLLKHFVMYTVPRLFDFNIRNTHHRRKIHVVRNWDKPSLITF